MAAISLLGFSLPDGLILSKAVNSNMASSVTNNSKQEATNLTKTFSKITVQNVLSENNGNSINISNNNAGGSSSANSANTIVRKIKDFGMVGAVNNAAGNISGVPKSLIMRKRPLVEAKNITNVTNKPTTPVTKKVKTTKEPTTPKPTAKKSNTNNENVLRPKKPPTNLNGLNPKPAGTPGRKGLPLPQAVARRNARERNRVKQVNNGFAALRERIPEEVAEAFESQGSNSGRGNCAKKLSKVETLRMAVEYIRSLEQLLGFDISMNTSEIGGRQGSGSSGEDSFTLIKDEFDALSPSLDENFDDSMSNYDMDDYFATNNNINNKNDSTQAEMSPQLDLLPDITTLNGLQYIRIPGTNTYQLLTPDIFVGTTHSPPNSSLDDEQFNSLIDANCMSPIAMATTTAQAAINPNNSASPTTATSATPASPHNAAAQPYGECVSTPTLSTRLSPVPMPVQQRTTMSSSSLSSPSTSSPDAGSSSSLYHQQQTTTTLTLSPADALLNERTLQTCATANVAIQQQQQQRHFIAPTLPHLLPHFIKQEYVGDQVDFISTTRSPSSNSLYQTTTAGDQHATHSLSPPLDGCDRLLMAPQLTSAIELHSFYEQDDSGSFYDNNLAYKKELNNVLLNASTATNAGLSDESMIEAIDWWEANASQTESGVGGVCKSVML